MDRVTAGAEKAPCHIDCPEHPRCMYLFGRERMERQSQLVRIGRPAFGVLLSRANSNDIACIACADC